MTDDRTRMSQTAALIARLRQHEAGARQQCACSSRLENCMVCDCGLAADEIERLREDKMSATEQLTVVSMSGMNAAEQAVYDCKMSDGDGLSVLIHSSGYIDDSLPLQDQLDEVRSICRTIAFQAIASYLRSST